MKQDAPQFQTRLYIDQPLAAGKALGVDSDQAHHMRNVLRMSKGQKIGVFNGQDGEFMAEITELDRKSGWIKLTNQTRKQAHSPDVWLLFAPLKKEATDFVVEKATELGAAALWPVITERTQTKRVNTERFLRNAIGAAEQSERMDIPKIRDAAPLWDLLETWPEERHLIVCAERGETQSAARVMDILPAGPAAILVGPEGGFAESELDKILKLPFAVPVSLGPRILRADTAAIAALTCYQAMIGDWCK